MKYKKFIISIVSILLLLSALVYNILYINNQKNKIVDEINFEEKEEEIKETEEKTIFIDISGEVYNPGMYELKEGSRLNDAIVMAGGVTEKADLNTVNLAYILSDAMKIVIPQKEIKKILYKTTSQSSVKPIISTASIVTESQTENRLININTATKEQLITLPGIGSATAEKIIKYKNENGNFNEKEDIKNVSGIGEEKYKTLTDKITI